MMVEGTRLRMGVLVSTGESVMKTHPTLAALAKAKVTAEPRTIEGYLEVEDRGAVRIHSSLTGGVTWEVDPADVLHDEELRDTNGKSRVYITPSASVKLIAILRLPADDASGTHCGDSGIMYCWRRIRTSDGTIIIIMEPCGSCPSAAMGGGFLARV